MGNCSGHRKNVTDMETEKQIHGETKYRGPSNYHTDRTLGGTDQ